MLDEEDKEVTDDSGEEEAKVWKELGRSSPQSTTPPLIPVVSSTSQPADTAISIAFMAWMRKGPSMSAGSDS